MDRLSAHLDRGWDLVSRGDAPGAAECGKRALELDPKSPEVHNLLGYSAALAGEAQEALEHYKQAIALDENYFEAMLNAAEVLLTPLGEIDEALRMCDEATDVAETDEEIADCFLLKVDALIAKGDLDGARKAMNMLPEGITTPAYLFMMGRAYYELGDVEKAAPLIEEAARRDPQHADAQYYLGLVKDDAGDGHAATDAFLRTRALDSMREPPAWAPSADTFGKIVEQAIGKLDTVLARYVTEVAVYVVDVPGSELVVDGIDPRAPMLLEPGTVDGRATRLFVYQRNIERIAGALEHLETELVAGLEREITAVFLDDPGKQPKREQLN